MFCGYHYLDYRICISMVLQDFPWASIVDYSVSIIYSLAFACSSSQTDISQEHLNSLQAQLEFHSKSLSNLFASIYNYHDVDAFDIMRPSTLDTLFEMLGFHFRVCPQAILHNILLVCLSWSQLSMNPEDRAHRQTPYFRHALDSGRKTLLQFLQSRLPDSLLSGLLQLISGLCRLFSPKWMLGHQSETELVHTHAEDNRCENVDRQTSIPESIRFLLLVVRISGVELKLSLDSAETCLVQHVDEGGVVGQDTNEGDDRSAEEKIMTEREMSSLATGRYGGSFGSSNTEHVPEDLRPPKNVPYKSVEPLSREKRASKAFHDYESLMLTIISCCEILESTMDFVSKYASVEPQQDGDGNKNPLSGLDYESVASIKSAFHSPFEVCHSFLLAIKDSEIYPFVCDISGAVNIFQMATDVSPAVFNTWTDKKSLCSKEGRATAVSLLYIPSIKFVCSFAFEDTEAYALEVSELAELLLFSKKLSLKAMDRMNLHDQIKLSMVLPFISGTDAPILDLPIVYAFPLFLNRLHQEVLLDRFMDLHGELLCMDWLLQWSRAVAIAVMEMQSQETQERSSPSALSVLSLDLSSTVLQILLMLNEKRASDQEKREICGLDTEKLKPVADSLFKLDLKLKTNVKLFYNNKNVFVGFIHWTHALACLLCDIFDSDCQLVECAWQIYDKESSLKILRSIGTSAACPLWQFHRLQNEPFGDESYSKLWESLLKRIGKICAQQTKYSESFKSLMKEPVRRSFGKQLEQYIRLVATENKWGDKAPSSDTTVTQWLFQQIEGIEREISNASEAIGDELQDVKNLLESIQRCIE